MLHSVPSQSIFKRSTSSPALVRSQFAAFSRQLPLLYFILVTNTSAVAFTHWRTAPLWLGVVAPALMCTFCMLRVVMWFRRQNRYYDDAVVARRLRTTLWLVGLLGILFTAWGLLLFPYGDAYARCHVAFFMAITVIGCVFCLMHMRAAALLLAGIVIVPDTVFLALTGNTVLIAMALNIALVSVAMIVILLIYYRDFNDLIVSQTALSLKQSETEALSNENFRLATVDSLTDLPNRRQFFSDLDAFIATRQSHMERFAVGVLDMDGFKQVNDHYGHATGDRVLEEVGRRLKTLLSADLLIARLGGDEFGLLVCGEHRATVIVCDGVCQALQMPYVLPDTTVRISSSIGLAQFPDAGQSASQLFERADFALYFAKAQRRGRTVMFSAEHETEIKRVNDIELALGQANLAQEMSVAFQPIFDATEQRIVSFEALARWLSPVLGPVSPVNFIPVAERSDLIHQITAVLLTKTLDAAADWPEDIRVSFNLSSLDLTRPEALSNIMAITRNSGVSAERIDFEITESVLIKDYDGARAALTQLKAMGVCISLDDFGTGYSSLSYIHRLPLDKIKIDRSFIFRIDTEVAGRDIVKSIVSLCGHLGLACIVEGVETHSQVAILRDLGCRYMQGYWFGKPMPQQAVLGLLGRSWTALA